MRTRQISTKLQRSTSYKQTAKLGRWLLLIMEQCTVYAFAASTSRGYTSGLRARDPTRITTFFCCLGFSFSNGHAILEK